MPTPVWKEIYGALRREIAENVYRTGDKLPTEKELSERFSVNRHTVRRALAELTNEGAIYVRRGSGAYVAEGVIEYPLVGDTRFCTRMQELGRKPTTIFVGSDLLVADEKLAGRMGLRPGAQVIRIESTAHADGLPIVFTQRHFPHERFPDLVGAFHATGSVGAALARFGVVETKQAWMRLTATSASRSVAQQLRQIDVQPVIRTETLSLDMAGQPVEYTFAHWAGARAQFVLDPA